VTAAIPLATGRIYPIKTAQPVKTATLGQVT